MHSVAAAFSGWIPAAQLFFFHARTYSTLNVEGKSLSSGIPNHLGIVSLSKIR